MKKMKKLSIESIKVKSFVTELSNKLNETVKAGMGPVRVPESDLILNGCDDQSCASIHWYSYHNGEQGCNNDQQSEACAGYSGLNCN